MNAAVGSREWFDTYLTAFNEARFEDFAPYYAEDVEFFGRAARKTGRQAIIDHYRMIRSKIDEHIEVLSFLGSAEKIAAEIVTTLDPLVDWPDFPTGALKAGVRRQSVNFIWYDIRDGQFSRIRSAGFRVLG